MSVATLIKRSTARLLIPLLLSLQIAMPASGRDLEEIRQSGVLRHLGAPYAHFVTGSGDGLDVELITLFAEYLGVQYRFVETNWKDVIADLSGKKFVVHGENVEITGNAPVRGDLIANGLTVIPWRKALISYSNPTFISGVWLLTKAEYNMSPIRGSSDMQRDIDEVKAGLKGRELFGVANTCLGPQLYNLAATGARVKLYQPPSDNPVELIPALLSGEAETILLDIPDALVALEKWPERIKVIGPVSMPQEMGVGFVKESVEMRKAFDTFFEQIKRDGRYLALLRKYFPGMSSYFNEFFSG